MHIRVLTVLPVLISVLPMAKAEGVDAFSAEPAVWPEPTAEMKPWVYNWWMGSAVDAAGLEYQCAEMVKQGFGGFHVIPIYGAKGGYEKKWRTLLSSDWIEAWNLAARTARSTPT